MPTKEELEIEIATLKSKVELREKEMEEFRQSVIATARTYANDHNWCEVVDRALLDLGLIKKTSVQFTITRTWIVDAELNDANYNGDLYNEDALAQFVRDSLDSMGEEPVLDDDWSDVEVTDRGIEIKIESVEK